MKNLCALVLSVLLALATITGVGCGLGEAQTSNSAAPAPTPSTRLTASDVGKLKWLEGTWRGMDGQNPFYERYRFEGTTMIVETLDEKGNVKPEDTARFELTSAGEFGPAGKSPDSRSGASAITDSYVQFVPFPGSKSNSYRFERRKDGTPSWSAVLEWSASADKPAGQKIYNMEPWTPPSR